MAATRFNRKVRLVAALLLGSAGSATAQNPPAPFPVPATEEPIEIYYGAKRLTAEPAPLADAVVPASAVVESPRTAESFRDAMVSVRDGSREITSATVGLLGMVGGRIKQTADSRPIIINTAATPVQAAVQPQVVVVREAVEVKAATEAPATIRLETLLACGLGLAALGLVAWIGSRKSHKSMIATPTFAYTPTPLDPNSVNLMGKYNAGPKREDAEKFELGPTFHEELQKKEQQIEASNTAAVEFILSQNLAFLAELNPEAEGVIVQTDEEGFAVPALA